MSEPQPGRPGFFDLKFRGGMLRFYFFQSALATAAIVAILALLRGQLAFAAAMGSSAFVVFAAPGSRSAQPRCLLGGHFFCLGLGLLCHLLVLSGLLQTVGLTDDVARLVAAGAAVGLSVFVMVITDTEHPPAAGVAMGAVLNKWSSAAVVTVIVGVLVLSTVRYLLRNVMRDLT